MNYKRTLNLILIFLLCLSFITPLFTPLPVLAAEEEEEDNFTTMPNYRWENQSTTDSAVSEQLIGDNYEVYNYNNETSGTQKFEKSRELNSRDFYYESRFALDVGGNQTEYFRDVVGDACDFEEGDQEGWVDNEGDATISVSDGIISVVCPDDYDGINHTIDVSSSGVYTGFEFRIRSTDNDMKMLLAFFHTDHTVLGFTKSIVVGTSWETFSFTNWSDWDSFGSEDQMNAWTDIKILTDISEDEYPNTFFIDYIELIGSLDYATHVESEVEDTWDWEDSDEYWYDEEGNVSDFNDGSLEGWDNMGVDTDVSNDDGWLEIHANMIADRLEVNVSSLSIDASVYGYLTMEAHCINGTIDTINVFDSDFNPVGVDATNIAAGEYYLYNLDLGADANWTGTETGLGLYFYFTSSSADNELELNMTYLYDVALGDIEGFTGVDRTYVNPQGWLSGTCAAGANAGPYTPSGLSIDTGLFNVIKVRTKTDDPNLTMRLRRADDWTFPGEMKYYGGTDWVIFEWDLSDDSYWIDTSPCTRFQLHCDEVDGTLEGNELVIIDYVLVLGHWSESDGFKYSLLNADDEEGMSFQFTRNSDNSYNLSIDMYDSVGVALDYIYSFNYDIDVDGWLRLRVDWHLDKRNVKIHLTFDNGTTILRVRRITDLYGGYLGFSNLLLLKDGFPSLCMNNSISSLARSYVIINYIDADWNILEWRDPTGTWHYEPAYDVYQDSSSEDHFTAVTPYGCTLYKKENIGYGKWYRISVDRFDGLNFEYDCSQENMDATDYFKWNFGAYNVHKNGTYEPVFRFCISVNPGTTDYIDYYVYVSGTLETCREMLSTTECQGGVSIYYESSSKIVMQYKYSNANDDFQGTLTARPMGEELFTKEMVFVTSYKMSTTAGGYDDDILEFSVGGFELTRKDILGWIIGAILGPFFNLIGILFSPFIILFQILTLALVKAFKDLATALEPFFETLGGIFGVAISALGTAIGGFLETLEEGLVTAFEGLWGLLWLLFEELGRFIYDVLEFLIPILIDLIEIVYDLGVDILVWVLSTLGLSALLDIFFLVRDIFMGAVAGAPQLIVDVTTFIFLFGNMVLVLWWVWCVLLPVVSLNPGEAMGEIINRFFMNAFPWDILGFHIYIPQGIVVTGLTYFLIIAPTGSGFAIW